MKSAVILAFVCLLVIVKATSPPHYETSNGHAEYRGPNARCRVCEQQQKICLQSCLALGLATDDRILAPQDLQKSLEYHPNGPPGTWSYGNAPGTSEAENAPSDNIGAPGSNEKKTLSDFIAPPGYIFRAPGYARDIKDDSLKRVVRSAGKLFARTFRSGPPGAKLDKRNSPPVGPPSGDVPMQVPWASPCIRQCLDAAFYCNINCLEDF